MLIGIESSSLGVYIPKPQTLNPIDPMSPEPFKGLGVRLRG